MMKPLSRRTVLRGLGTALALPWLEAMLPRESAAAPGATKAGGPPLRIAWLYVPNGIHMPDWTPGSEGRNFDLPPILKPLAAHRN